MATTEERMKILKMVEDGKISAEEGARLLAALSQGRKTASTGMQIGTGSARWLRIRITDTHSGRSKTSVQIPLTVVEAGLKIGARFAPEVEGVDMSNIIDALRAGITGKIIDVIDEEGDEHVEIFVE